MANALTVAFILTSGCAVLRALSYTNLLSRWLSSRACRGCLVGVIVEFTGQCFSDLISEASPCPLLLFMSGIFLVG